MLGGKGLELASERGVQRTTGFQVGAVSVLGFRSTDIAAYVDRGVLALETVIISSGRPDTELAVNPELLLQAMQAQVLDLAS